MVEGNKQRRHYSFQSNKTELIASLFKQFLKPLLSLSAEVTEELNFVYLFSFITGIWLGCNKKKIKRTSLSIYIFSKIKFVVVFSEEYRLV